jgi:hypothetical protein
MNKYTVFSALALVSGCAVTPALAKDPVPIKPIIDARLRWEDVDQTGKANTADAVTVRVRAGFEAQLPAKFSLLAEATGTLGIDNDYFNNTSHSGKPTALYPTIADPQTIGLNRLQLAYKGLQGTTITVGRQRINLDDQRFVGNAGWRDNEQTFDAVRIETTPIKNLKADLTYAITDNTIFGIDGQVGVNTGHITGDNVFGTFGYTTTLGTLEGFGFLVNQAQAARFKFSSKTFGGRFVGKYAFDKKTSLSYTLSYANQSDVHLNPNRYSANYYYGDVALNTHGWSLGGGYELLGTDSGARVKSSNALATTSFQTPLATLHKWNGWADIFLTTPANGLTDAYGSIGYTSTKVKPLTSLGASVIYHDYRSDVAGQHYGHEWDAQIMAKVKKYTFLLKYADYSANAFATDTKKLWASVEWAF